MKYFAIVSYLGTNYSGWQSQKDKSGIEDVIENLISNILNEKINIVGSGRTDKGVHAFGQTFHFETTKPIKDINHFLYALNRLLPNDIKILKLKKIKDEFHARFSSIKKEYIYKIYIGKYSPLYITTHYVPRQKINYDLFLKTKEYFIGKKNFKNLTSKEIDDKNFIRTIYDIQIKKTKDEIIIKFIGNAFMKYMVRYIVGEMIYVSTYNLDSSILNKLFLEGKRKISNHKAEPQGLYLNKVYYE